MCGFPLESKAIDVSLSLVESTVVMCHVGIGVGVGIEVAVGVDVGVGLSMGCVVGVAVATIFGVEEGEGVGKVVVIGSTGLGAVNKKSETTSTVTITPVEITRTFLFEKEFFPSCVAGIFTSWGSQPRILFFILFLRFMLSARG